jgi:hypothetical protein
LCRRHDLRRRRIVDLESLLGAALFDVLIDGDEECKP